MNNKNLEISVGCETERECSCNNFEIINCERTRNNEIYIHFKKVQFSDFCLTSLGPAKCIIDLVILPEWSFKTQIVFLKGICIFEI